VQPDREGRVVAPAVGDHHDRVVYPHLGVHDRAVGHVVAARLPGIEGLDQEVDDTLRAIGNDVRRDARIPLRLVWSIHGAPPVK
jgi:hypothetical protein